MKPKALKNIYKFFTFVLFASTLLFFAQIFNWNLKWYHIVIVVLLSQYFGKLIYVIKIGVNPSNIQFLENSELNNQEFTVDIPVGFAKVFLLHGYFDHNVGLTPKDLSVLIYTQTTRKMLLPLINNDCCVTLEYNLGNEVIYVTFDKVLN